MVSASSVELSGRQSASALSRTRNTRLPSGCGAAVATVRVLATQPMKAGFSTSLVSSPVTRSSR